MNEPISNKRFPIKADTKIDAYLLPRNRVKGSIPWDDAIPILKRWFPRFADPGVTFEEASTKLAASGGLDHKTMEAYSAKQYDHWTNKMLPELDWRTNFVPDTDLIQNDDQDFFDPLSPSEIALFSTVRIQTRGINNKKGFATGFLFKARDDNKERRFIITNKHVFEGYTSAVLSFHISKDKDNQSAPTGLKFDFELSDLTQIIYHTDSELDLCAIPFDSIEQEAWTHGKDLFAPFIDSDILPSTDTLHLMPLTQEVYMYGYPIGLWDMFNQLPIVRRGSLASHPAPNYCGKPSGAVDIAAFPGSSGSPIFILSDGGPMNDKLGNVFANRRIAVFLGVLSSGAQVTKEGGFEMIAIPADDSPIHKNGMLPIHLGFYIKGEEVAKFANDLL